MREARLITWTAALLLACTGSGGGSTGTTVPSPLPTRTALTLKGINLSSRDVIVSTAASINGQALAYSRAASTATGLPSVSRKLVDGLLARLDPVVASATGEPVSCDLSTVEVLVSSLLELSSDYVVADITYPSEVTQGCSFSYTSRQFLVDANYHAFPVDSLGTKIVSAVSSEDVGANSSGMPVVLGADGVARLLQRKDDTTISFVELATNSEPLNGRGFITNGISTAVIEPSLPGILLYSVGSPGFKIIRIYDPITLVVDHEGDFLVSGNIHSIQRIDLSTGELTPKWADAITDAYAPYHQLQQPYIDFRWAKGRSGSILLSNECAVVDLAARTYISAHPLPIEALGYNTFLPPEYYIDLSVMHDHYGYCVNQNKNAYSRFDANTGAVVRFNTDDLGFLVSSYRMTKNAAYLEILNSSNSDKEYVELNFDTGAVNRLGVIAQGGRTVTDVVSLF